MSALVNFGGHLVSHYKRDSWSVRERVSGQRSCRLYPLSSKFNGDTVRGRAFPVASSATSGMSSKEIPEIDYFTPGLKVQQVTEGVWIFTQSLGIPALGLDPCKRSAFLKNKPVLFLETDFFSLFQFSE